MCAVHSYSAHIFRQICHQYDDRKMYTNTLKLAFEGEEEEVAVAQSWDR